MSWSGDRSKAIATEFKAFLSVVLQQADPFLSSQDIDLGVTWQKHLLTEISERRFGLIFITPENKNSEWLHYEAGGLIKDLNQDRVVPILFGLKKADVSSPFSLFQMIEFDRESVLTLLKQINARTEKPLEQDSLNAVFEAFFEKTEEKISKIISESPQTTKKRTSEDLLDELITLSRNQTTLFGSLIKKLGELSYNDPGGSFSSRIKPFGMIQRDSFINRIRNSAQHQSPWIFDTNLDDDLRDEAIKVLIMSISDPDVRTNVEEYFSKTTGKKFSE